MIRKGRYTLMLLGPAQDPAAILRRAGILRKAGIHI